MVLNSSQIVKWFTLLPFQFNSSIMRFYLVPFYQSITFIDKIALTLISGIVNKYEHNNNRGIHKVGGFLSIKRFRSIKALWRVVEEHGWLPNII